VYQAHSQEFFLICLFNPNITKAGVVAKRENPYYGFHKQNLFLLFKYWTWIKKGVFYLNSERVRTMIVVMFPVSSSIVSLRTLYPCTYAPYSTQTPHSFSLFAPVY
jgi:hypothetical protein